MATGWDHRAVMYGLVTFLLLVVQAVFGAWTSHYIAAGRPGVNIRRWTVVGGLCGVAGPLLTWEFAGWRRGEGGLQELRRSRAQRVR